MSGWNGLNNLDLSDVQEAGDPVLKTGKYVVTCTDAFVEQIGTTPNRKLVLQLNGGGGQIRCTLNIHHTSQQAQDIALRQLKSFLVASGYPTPDRPGDVSSLKGLEVGIIVGEGKQYTNRDGKTITPTEVKRFFEPAKFDEMVVMESRPAASRLNGSQQQAVQNTAMMDDEIPF